jgi:hypothetical protein
LVASPFRQKTCWEATSAQRSVALKREKRGKNKERRILSLTTKHKKDCRFGQWVCERDERFQSRNDSQTASTYINPVTPSDHPSNPNLKKKRGVYLEAFCCA